MRVFALTQGSRSQLALLIAPVLVFVGPVNGRLMGLPLGAFETVSVARAVSVGARAVRHAKSHRLAGEIPLPGDGMLGVALHLC